MKATNVVELRPTPPVDDAATPTANLPDRDAEIIARFRRWWPRAPSSVRRAVKALIFAEEARAFDVPAREVLAFLNSKRPGKRGFRASEGNLRLIRARIADGITVPELRAIVVMKAREVESGEFDARWMRPATLFNREKCEQYLGALGDG